MFTLRRAIIIAPSCLATAYVGYAIESNRISYKSHNKDEYMWLPKPLSTLLYKDLVYKRTALIDSLPEDQVQGIGEYLAQCDSNLTPGLYFHVALKYSIRQSREDLLKALTYRFDRDGTMTCIFELFPI